MLIQCCISPLSPSPSGQERDRAVEQLRNMGVEAKDSDKQVQELEKQMAEKEAEVTRFRAEMQALKDEKVDLKREIQVMCVARVACARPDVSPVTIMSPPSFVLSRGVVSSRSW